MYKVLSAKQLKAVDSKTIEKESISSFQLMERAASALLEKLYCSGILDDTSSFTIFCGKGNNGGDGLAIARMLLLKGKKVQVNIIEHKTVGSADFERNLEILRRQTNTIRFIAEGGPSFKVSKGDVIIDCILGTGLHRPIKGFLKSVVEQINDLENLKIAVDSPSGLFMEDNSHNNMEAIIKADYTFTIGLPKLSFFFPSISVFTGKWFLVPIGLDTESIEKSEGDYYFINKGDISGLLVSREEFSHKGLYGHALVLAGSYGKIGAAVLCAKACLKTGAGLLSVVSPKCGYQILQTSIPEAMVITSPNEDTLTDFKLPLDYSAVAIGPGIRISSKTADFLYKLLTKSSKPLILDADALNILSENKEYLKLLPKNSILTPHPGEFKRLVGTWKNDFDRLKLLKDFAQKHQVYVILKGKYSRLACPSGEVYFNSTGNPGMATAGSGDVLTGMIVSLLAQAYKVKDAALLGMYLHGLAGDVAAEIKTEFSLMASDIVEAIPSAYQLIQDNK